LNRTLHQPIIALILAFTGVRPSNAQDNFGIQPVGSFFDSWDWVHLQSIQGDLACFSDGYNFRLLDVSNPEAIRPLSIIKRGEARTSLFCGDSGLYLFHTNGWSLVDISNHSEPVISWASTNVTQDFQAVAEGNLLCILGYAQIGFTLSFYDISNPQEPQPIRSIQLGPDEFVSDMVIHSGFLYLVGRRETLIYDLRNPEEPRLSDRIIPRGSDSQLYLNENSLNIVSHQGLTIYDLADPENPDSIGYYACHSLPTAFFGDICYMTLPDSNLIMLDISDPADIVEIDRVRLDNVPGNLIVNDNRLYASFTDSLVIYELSERQLRQPLGTYRPDMGFISGLTNTDNRIFFTSGIYNNRAIETLDIDNPLNPVSLDYYRYDQELYRIKLFNDDRRLYAATSHGGWQVKVFDIETSRTPSLMPVTIPVEEARKIVPWGELAVVLVWNDLAIFEQRDSLEYVEVSRFESGQRNCLDIAISGRRAIMLFADGIMVIDLTDPSNPQQVSFFETWSAERIIADEDYLFAFGDDVVSYLVTEDQTLQPIDTLSVKLCYPQPMTSGGFIACSSSRHYQDYEFAIGIVDCNNPYNLRLSGYFSSDILGYPDDIVIKDNFVFVGILESLVVFDCSEALSIPDITLPTPSAFHLDPPFPNPFNSSVTIEFGLDKSTPTRLAIFDISGRLVADLFSGKITPPPPPAIAGGASQTVTWDASSVGAGVYFVRLEAGEEVRTEKIVLMR